MGVFTRLAQSRFNEPEVAGFTADREFPAFAGSPCPEGQHPISLTDCWKASKTRRVENSKVEQLPPEVPGVMTQQHGCGLGETRST